MHKQDEFWEENQSEQWNPGKKPGRFSLRDHLKTGAYAVSALSLFWANTPKQTEQEPVRETHDHQEYQNTQQETHQRASARSERDYDVRATSTPAGEQPPATQKITLRSSLPIYIGAGAFALLALALPVYKLWALAAALGGTLLVYVLAEKFTPKKMVEVPAEPETIKTGDHSADGVIAQGQEAMLRLRKLNEGIRDHLLTSQINRMEIACAAIFKAIEEKPARSGQVRRFMNYYLPTSLKLLEDYQTLTAVSTGQQNVENTRTRIRESMGMIADAFEKQLDNLYEADAIDITADIEVLESMLKSEGLK